MLPFEVGLSITLCASRFSFVLADFIQSIFFKGLLSTNTCSANKLLQVAVNKIFGSLGRYFRSETLYSELDLLGFFKLFLYYFSNSDTVCSYIYLRDS